MKYTFGWIIIVLAFAGLETLALVDPGAGDTFSEHIWELLAAQPWLIVPGLAATVWAAYHLFFQKR